MKYQICTFHYADGHAEYQVNHTAGLFDQWWRDENFKTEEEARAFIASQTITHVTETEYKP